MYDVYKNTAPKELLVDSIYYCICIGGIQTRYTDGHVKLIDSIIIFFLQNKTLNTICVPE